jgi:hypothetical protein
MRSLIVVILVAALGACAHVTTPPATEMVEVANAPPSLSPPPLPPPSPPEVKHTTKRAALVTSGLVTGIIGLALTGAAVGVFAAPRSSSPDSWDDFGDSLGRAVVGTPLLAIGVPNLVGGLTVTLVGVSRKD